MRAALRLLSPCRLCPRRCGADRLGGDPGYCGTGRQARVASFGPHFGEEPPLVGTGGSGTIFFAGCNLGCVFCQNHDISHPTADDSLRIAATPAPRLAEMMLDLQAQGCHNINLVTPSHVMPQVLEALDLAAEGGLRLPLVWNCGGYEAGEALQLLDGIVDIYMPDMKYGDPAVGERLSDAPDYPARAREALTEMHRQVGDLALDERGLARRGLIVRHLVLPNGLSGTRATAEFLAGLSRQTYLNIMDQYRPRHQASAFAEVGRRITPDEFAAAVAVAREAGLTRLDDRGPRRLAL